MICDGLQRFSCGGIFDSAMSTEELAGLKGIGIEGSIMADNDIRIAVIGGSTFDRSFCGDRPFAEGLAKVEGRFRADTGAGQSPTIHRMRYGEVPFFFVDSFRILSRRRLRSIVLCLTNSVMPQDCSWINTRPPI